MGMLLPFWWAESRRGCGGGLLSATRPSGRQPIVLAGAAAMASTTLRATLIAPRCPIAVGICRGLQARRGVVICERRIQVALRTNRSVLRALPGLIRPIALVGDGRARMGCCRYHYQRQQQGNRAKVFGRHGPAPSLFEAPHALLMMNSERLFLRLQAHADVKELAYQRNSRGPNTAPASVHSTIVPPYQTATNGNESSVQCSAYAIALTPPAMSPATAPARTRLVGAALRTAKIVTAKGTIAMIGIESRHSSHSSPSIIRFQCELGAAPRLIAPNSAIAANGTTIVSGDIPRSAPGRACLVR